MPTLHTTLSDYIDDEEPQEFPVFVGLRKELPGLAGPSNMFCALSVCVQHIRFSQEK